MYCRAVLVSSKMTNMSSHGSYDVTGFVECAGNTRWEVLWTGGGLDWWGFGPYLMVSQFQQAQHAARDRIRNGLAGDSIGPSDSNGDSAGARSATNSSSSSSNGVNSDKQ